MNFKVSNTKRLMAVGVASILWTLWNTRNGACFRNFSPVDPVSIISQIPRYIHFWAGLQRTKLRDKQKSGAKRILAVANEIFHWSEG
jgi:hypothetical protein